MFKRAEIKLILLDRDGVINIDSPDYILSEDQWQPIEGSLEAMSRLCQAGFQLAVISNQSAVGRKMISMETMNKIHQKMLKMVEETGGQIAYSTYCPHAPEDDCSCRKPKPGMITETLEHLNIHPEHALMVGDSSRDIEAAHHAGVAGVLLASGYKDPSVELQKAHAFDANVPAFKNLQAFTEEFLA